MDPAYVIRPATARDIESVVALERKIEDVPHWAVADYLRALDVDNDDVRTEGVRRCFFVALAEGQIIGFAVGRVTAIENEVLADLESVGVATSVRRKGVGRSLCESVIVWALGQRATEMELEVRSASVGAIALYRRLGFETTGTRSGYYRLPKDDAVLMRLDLVESAAGKANADSLRE